MPSKKPANIDQYIAAFPEDVREKLTQIRETVRKVVPTAEETIKYDMPTYVLNGNLVYFAAFKNHIGFYGAPTAVKSFEEDLKPFKQGKGSLQFPLDKPMPLELIRKIVEWRIGRIGSRQK